MQSRSFRYPPTFGGPWLGKVERPGSIDDFRDLRDACLEAVMKAKGKEIALIYRDRLDRLLHLGETAP